MRASIVVGLLIAAIEDNDPVVFLEPKRIYNGPFSGYYDRPVEPWSKHDASAVPEGYYRIDLGKAATLAEIAAWPGLDALRASRLINGLCLSSRLTVIDAQQWRSSQRAAWSDTVPSRWPYRN